MSRILSTLFLVFIITSLRSQISIIGTATPASEFTTDFNMTQNSQNQDLWSITISLFAEEVKFRKDNNWTINWGAIDFPAGIGVQAGPNIPISDSGTYEITFNEATGAYSFTLLPSGSVGIGISAPDSSAALEVTSANQGILIPRMNNGQISQIVSPANGLLVYNTDRKTLYAYKDNSWAAVANEDVLQDSDQDTKIQVEENPDDDLIRFDVDGTEFGRIYKNRFHFNRRNGNTYLGFNAGLSDSSGFQNTFIGDGAGILNKEGTDNTYLGFLSGYKTLGSNNAFLGAGTGRENINGSSNVFLGDKSGRNSDGSGNIFIGRNAGRFQKGDNKLLIENSQADSTGALIYGEFDNNLLRVNGVLIPTEGLSDVDLDTKIQLRENPVGDSIRFEVEGSMIAALTSIGLSMNDGSGNIIIGDAAGNNIESSAIFNSINGFAAGRDLEGGDYNTMMGSIAGRDLIGGSENVFLGSSAGYQNENGNQNVFIGRNAGGSNLGGSGNVFIGYGAGAQETGSNKLFINNSDALPSQSLIYGEFDNDIIRINGRLIPTGGINDVDQDTKIHLEKSADEDAIRFDVGGTEAMQINSQGRVFINTSGSFGALESQMTVNGIDKPIGLEVSGGAYGVLGSSSGSGSSSHFGVFGIATGTSTNYGVYGSANGGTTNFAGFFQGNVNVTNALTIDNITIQEYTGGLTDIPGSNFGSRISGPENSHIVFDVNGNDVNDGMYVRVPSSPSSINNDADKTMLAVTGKGVGIDVSDITRAKLEVVGTFNSVLSSFNAKLDGLGVSTAGFLSSDPLSAFFSNIVAASEYRVFSDARVKNIIGRSDRRDDLAALMAIQVTDYSFIDTITHGLDTYKKVIAQELAKVYPQAVSNKLQEVIPDIYRTASIRDGWIQVAADIAIGDQVKIITKDHSEVYEVIEVSPEAFKVAGLATHLDKVFVYGRQVDDFHTVDYEAISMLNVSATQAQQELLEKQQHEIDELKSKVDKLIRLLEGKQTVQASKM